MTPARLDHLRQIVDSGARGSITILPSLREAAVELCAEVLILRAELTRLTPTWRDGEPPQNGAYVWREHPQGATIVEVLSTEDRADYDGDDVRYWDSVDGPVSWGTARWCPIGVPK